MYISVLKFLRLKLVISWFSLLYDCGEFCWEGGWIIHTLSDIVLNLILIHLCIRVIVSIL